MNCATATISCPHCGLTHFGGAVCPRVKAIAYYENGTIKRVEYHESAAFIPTPPIPPWKPVNLDPTCATGAQLVGAEVMQS